MSLFLLTVLLHADDAAAGWAGLLGSDGGGVAVVETPPPTSWAADKNVAWSVPLPGRGDSSPCVAGPWLHLTAQTRDDRLHVLTIDRRTGRLHKQTAVARGEVKATGPRSLWADRHNAASPTPVADGQRVWAFFGTGLLVALEAESHRELWRRDLVADYGAYDITFGMGASPRLAERAGRPVLLVSCITKGASYVLCLDAATGQEVWQTDRRYAVFADAADAYAAPVVREPAAGSKTGTEVVVVGADRIDGYALADGSRRWVGEGLGIDSPYARIIASPAVGRDDLAGLLIACSGNPSGGGNGFTAGFAVNDARGTCSRLWTHDKGSPDSCSPLLVGRRVVLLSGQGILTTLDAATGQPIGPRGGSTRLRGEYFASPLAVRAGDEPTRLYALSTDGRCSVLAFDETAQPPKPPELLDVNTLPGTFYASPAISGSTLYLRAWQRLYAISP